MHTAATMPIFTAVKVVSEAGAGDCEIAMEDADAEVAPESDVDEGVGVDIWEGVEDAGTGSVADPVPNRSSAHRTGLSDTL